MRRQQHENWRSKALLRQAIWADLGWVKVVAPSWANGFMDSGAFTRTKRTLRVFNFDSDPDIIWLRPILSHSGVHTKTLPTAIVEVHLESRNQQTDDTSQWPATKLLADSLLSCDRGTDDLMISNRLWKSYPGM